MKIGCAVGCFTYPHYDVPYEGAIRKIGELGFDGLELIVAEKEDLFQYYTPSRVKELRNMYKSYGMELSEFALYANVVTGLMETEKAEKQKAYDLFKKGTEIALELGTDKINIVSNWPNEFTAPIPYLPCHYHPNGISPFSPKLKMDIPRNYDAKGAWDNYIESLQVLTEICEENQADFLVEGHANVVVGTTDAFLRAADQIQNERFCTNFDTAWQLVQREYLPWSVYKLGKKIKHVHVRDGDGMLCYSYPPGMGIIDWNGFVKALMDIGYEGFLSLELAGFAEPDRYIKEAKEYLERILKEEGIRYDVKC